jgi:hyperosmotically inducible protein
MNPRAVVWRAGGLAAAAALSCALVAPALAAPTDAWLTTKVKLALLTTEHVSGTAFSVDTVNHQVTLHGTVRSAGEREEAESIAKAIDGVQGVRNLLQVVAAERASTVPASDDDIKVNVAMALKADASLKDSSISVQAVNKGVVLLGGEATTLTDHLAAVEVAAHVKGVRRVASEIQSPDTLADADIWRDRKLQLSYAGYGVTNATRDVWITSATKMILLADRRTPALAINVDSRNGVVTLFGVVSGHDAKAAAEADARDVSGVKRVMNELQVVSSAKQPAVEARDDEIEGDVKKGFATHADFKDIGVEVKNCVARLTGAVPTGIERLQAMQVARATTGVCSVQDDRRLAD